MMFWGDIILHHPELIKKLPKDVIALNWGYEANHPFEKETAILAKSKVPFYVCPGTATWMTLLGRHDTAFANLRLAAEAGRKNDAIGYLNTDWGDGGHPQPLAISWPLYAIGAANARADKARFASCPTADNRLITAGMLDNEPACGGAPKTASGARAATWSSPSIRRQWR